MMASRRNATVLVLGMASFGGVRCCVAADTSIHTPDGPRRLGDLRVGDAVWSIDVATGRGLATRVVARRSAWRECVRLVHRSGALICTPDHPIYAPETNTYEPASRWVEGTRTTLLLAEAEHVDATPVLAVEAYAGVFEVVDISVASTLHNFVAGDVVVHNKYYEDPPSAQVEGPGFTLTLAEPTRRFEIRTCIAGREPSGEIDESSLYIELTTESQPKPATGQMSYAVYFATGAGSHVKDFPTDSVEFVVQDTLAGLCAKPVVIVFERLDDLPGAIGLTWVVYGSTQPPRGASIDDTLDIDIEG